MSGLHLIMIDFNYCYFSFPFPAPPSAAAVAISAAASKSGSTSGAEEEGAAAGDTDTKGSIKSERDVEVGKRGDERPLETLLLFRSLLKLRFLSSTNFSSPISFVQVCAASVAFHSGVSPPHSLSLSVTPSTLLTFMPLTLFL